jgi:tetratricopeptide (TPR) repeat protein
MQSLRRTFRLLLVFATVGLGSVSLGAQSEDHQAILQMIRSAGEAMRRGDAANAEALFKKVVAAAPSLSDAHLGLGMVQLREGKLDEAIHELSRATELNPQLPGAHLYLGIAQYQMGQAEAAIASLHAETVLQPRNSEAYTWLGIVELNQNHPELATGPLDAAKAVNPKDPRILYYCGRAHMLEAEADYRQLSAIDPDSGLVHRGLAENYDMGGQPEKAIAEYEAAVRKEPYNSDLYEALGEANLKMSRREAAIRAYEQALKLNPYSAIALYNLGRLDVEQGKPEQGVALLRKAEAVHASPAPTQFYLGFGLAELGQNEEAAQHLESSLAAQPSSFIAQSAYYQLARVYQKLNRKADAQKALAQLTKLKADGPTASAKLDGQMHDTGTGETQGPPGQEQPESNPRE